LQRQLIGLGILTIIALGTLGYFAVCRHGCVDDDTLTLYGNVDIRQVDLGFRVFGKVSELKFDEGESVEPGVLLATLDKVPYENELREAIAAAKEAEANYLNAKIIFERRKELIETGAVSQEIFTDSEAEQAKLRAAYDKALAREAIAKSNLEDTDLVAPSLGSILTRIRESGSIVNPGQPVYTLSLASPVWVRAFINEPDLGRIYPGMKAKIITDTPSLPDYEGHIGFISPVAEFTPKTVETTELRTDLVYRLRVIVDNPDVFLKQGMPVTVELPLHHAD